MKKVEKYIQRLFICLAGFTVLVIVGLFSFNALSSNEEDIVDYGIEMTDEEKTRAYEEQYMNDEYDTETENDESKSNTNNINVSDSDDTSYSISDTIDQIEFNISEIEEMVLTAEEPILKENDMLVSLDSFLYEPKIEGINKHFFTAGGVKLSNYYNYGFRDAKENYQAFELLDYKGNKIHFYAIRGLENTDLLIEDIQNDINVGYFYLSEPYNVDTDRQHMAELQMYMSPYME